MRRCLEKVPKTCLTASGQVEVKQNLIRPSGHGKSVCALDLRAGILGGPCTPVLARQVTYAMGHMTSVETTALFVELGVRGPSSSIGDPILKVVSEVWERNRQQWDTTLRVQEMVPAEAAVMAVTLDGPMVPDKAAQREAKAERDQRGRNPAKATSGPAGYREVRCGTVSRFDAQGDRLDTVHYARAPEYRKRILTMQFDAEVASIRATHPDLALVASRRSPPRKAKAFREPAGTHGLCAVSGGRSSHRQRCCRGWLRGTSEPADKALWH